MALLDATVTLAPALRLRCEVACVDHQLRREAAAELALVEREARARNLPFHSARIILDRGPGLEARARDVRYGALQKIRLAAKLDLLATAHTASDQAETVLMRLARGSSLSGAAGVRAVRGSVIRPMLACTREEVRAYLALRGVPFAEDAMNADPAFLRTRIRSDVLPALERATGPGTAQRVAHFAELAAEDSELLDAWAEAASRRLRLEDGSLDAVGLRLVERPLRRRIIARLLAGDALTVDAALVDQVEQVVAGDCEGATLPRGGILRAGGGRVRIHNAVGLEERAAPATLQAEERQQNLGRIELDGAPLRIAELGRHLQWTRTPVDRPAQPLPSSAGEVLLVRRGAQGDRVLLASGRTRKLQDVLTDARVPREKRSGLMVLANPDGLVVCVVGVWPRRGARARFARGSWLVDAPLAAEQAALSPLGYKELAKGR